MKITALAHKEAAQKENVMLALFNNDPVEKQEFFSYIPDKTRKILASFAAQEFKGEEEEIKSLWLDSSKPRRIVFFGLGTIEKWNERKNPLTSRRVVQYAKKENLKECAVFLPQRLVNPVRKLTQDIKSHVYNSEKNPITNNETFSNGVKDIKDTCQEFSENSLMAHFEFTKYKQSPVNGRNGINTLSLAVDNTQLTSARQGIAVGIIVGEETNLCRELANTPGSDMTPRLLAHAAVQVAKRTGLTATIFDEKKMLKLGMGAILGVGRGSVEKPRFIILEYNKGPKNQKPIVLAGKGVTFDTGGLNLKPDNYIYEMHMDMSGGAAVIHGLAAIARLKLPINAVGLIPAVENMPSGSSYRPGDQLKSMSGKTIEVLNTDAEGRVILADALTYGLHYNPKIMIDLATLTGAAHVALGNYCSAIFSNDEKLQNDLIGIGKKSGDYLWPLPLWDEYLSEIKGTFGDLANTGIKDRYGGASHGAKFLEQFAGSARFAHLDIAPRMTANDSEYLSKGASGVGVRLIAQIGKEYSNLLNSKRKA